MPTITFWSNNEKAIGQTVSAAIFSTVMAIEQNYKVLLVSADYNNKTMEKCFGAQESNNEIIKRLITKPQMSIASGIDGLLKLADSNKVTPEVIHDYTKIVFKNRLEILYSPMEIDEEHKFTIMEKLKNIVINASRYYDYVIVDLKKGLEYNEQKEILDISDIVVLNTDQNIETIENFFGLEEVENIQQKMVWNICRYDNKSKYNSKNLNRTILKRQPIGETPYNTLVSEAAQEGNIPELLIRFKTLKDEDENLTLIKRMEELIKNVLVKYQEIRTRI